jgi:hypothetical protein
MWDKHLLFIHLQTTPTPYCNHHSSQLIIIKPHNMITKPLTKLYSYIIMNIKTKFLRALQGEKTIHI